MQLTVKHLLVEHHIVLSRFFRLIQAELRIRKFHIQLNFISFCLRNDVYFVSCEALNSTHSLTLSIPMPKPNETQSSQTSLVAYPYQKFFFIIAVLTDFTRCTYIFYKSIQHGSIQYDLVVSTVYTLVQLAMLCSICTIPQFIQLTAAFHIKNSKYQKMRYYAPLLYC